MGKNIILLSFILGIATSCYKEGTIKVQNKIPNVRMESINFGEYGLATTILPGQTSEAIVVRDKKKLFPKNNKIEFYLVGSGNQVYLRTVEVFELDFDQDLIIVIDEDTEVENPLVN